MTKIERCVVEKSADKTQLVFVSWEKYRQLITYQLLAYTVNFVQVIDW